MRATLLVILTALLVASAQQATQQPPAAGQKKAPAAKPETASSSKKTFSFSDTVQLVIVDVSAKDKNGNPIQGLKPEDFVISEDGKPQKITTFQYQELINTPSGEE